MAAIHAYSSDELIERFDIAESLERYFALLADWNSKINLVSRETGRDDWRRLAVESIAPLAILEDDAAFAQQKKGWRRHLDIGSGGGFPAVPLVLTGKMNETLCIDSVGKKASALNNMLQQLGINGSSQQIRLEEWKSTDRFNLVTMRLVSLDIGLWKAIHRRIASNGLFIYYAHPKFDFKPSQFHVKHRAFRIDDSSVVKQLTYVFR